LESRAEAREGTGGEEWAGYEARAVGEGGAEDVLLLSLHGRNAQLEVPTLRVRREGNSMGEEGCEKSSCWW
jgi:hypothetical protein